jgi:hypothetical protein
MPLGRNNYETRMDLQLKNLLVLATTGHWEQYKRSHAKKQLRGRVMLEGLITDNRRILEKPTKNRNNKL